MTKKYIALAIILALALGAYGLLFYKKSDAQKKERENTTEKVMSRKWMEYAETVAMEKKPSPPDAAAHIYAYVATAYYNTLTKTGSSTQAAIASSLMLTKIYPDKEESNNKELLILNSAKKEDASPETLSIVSDLSEQLASDRIRDVWNHKIPEGPEFWIGKDPFSPAAGKWKRWVIGDSIDFNTPKPPALDSIEHVQALATVKEFAEKRDAEWSAKINFWAGGPGSATPSGIWQDRLFDITKEYNLSDKDYAYSQMVLSQAVADSFIECWKVKYTYWTKRPNMEDPSINIAMANPNFPGYVSGHSTISRTAAEVLSALFPDKKEIFMQDAADARDSRLYAGIHFPYDNSEGFVLGEKVGRRVIESLNLKPLVK